MIHTHVPSKSSVSNSAERFSNLPWPYECSRSAGRLDIRTAQSVMAAATRSKAECAASARIPKLLVNIPTTILIVVNSTAAISDQNATTRFSRSACAISTGISGCNSDMPRAHGREKTLMITDGATSGNPSRIRPFSGKYP